MKFLHTVIFKENHRIMPGKGSLHFANNLTICILFLLIPKNPIIRSSIVVSVVHDRPDICIGFMLISSQIPVFLAHFWIKKISWSKNIPKIFKRNFNFTGLRPLCRVVVNVKYDFVTEWIAIWSQKRHSKPLQILVSAVRADLPFLSCHLFPPYLLSL